MYCVVVSIRWVMSPVKINPGKRPEGKICKTCVQLTALQKVTWTSVRKSKRTSGCYGNLPQVMSIKRKVKGQGYSLQKEKIQTDTDKRRDLKKMIYLSSKKKTDWRNFFVVMFWFVILQLKAPQLLLIWYKEASKSLGKPLFWTNLSVKRFVLLCFLKRLSDCSVSHSLFYFSSSEWERTKEYI